MNPEILSVVIPGQSEDVNRIVTREANKSCVREMREGFAKAFLSQYELPAVRQSKINAMFDGVKPYTQ